MNKKIKALLSIFMAVIMCITSCGIVLAEDTAETAPLTAEELAAQSVVCYFNAGNVLASGELKEMDKTKNSSRIMDGNAYCEMAFLEETFGATYKWDGTQKAIVLSVGDKSCNIPCVIFDELDSKKLQGFFLDELTYIPMQLLCEGMGWGYAYTDNFWIADMSAKLPEELDDALINGFTELGKKVEGKYDFEAEKPELEAGYFDGASADTFVMENKIVTEDGNSFIQLGSSTLRYGGLYLPPVANTKFDTLQIECDARLSSDFAGSTFMVLVQGFKDGKFAAYLDGDYTTPAKDKWTHISFEIKQSDITTDIDDIRIIACTSNNAELGTPTGRAMVDNFVIKSIPLSETESSVSPLFAGDKAGHLYVLGDTITMTPENKLDEKKYDKIRVELRDSWGNAVHTETISVAELNKGYKWKPTKQGYYKFHFYTIDKNGIESVLYEFYEKKHPTTYDPVRFYVDGIGVVVTKNAAKPKEERNQKMFVSIDPNRRLSTDPTREKGLQGDQIEIAGKLGFGGVRFHAIEPSGEAYEALSHANEIRGVFDFSEFDESIADAQKYGLSIGLNILYTPRFAAPYREGYASPTGSKIGSYMPNNTEAWRAWVEAVVKHYKDVCNVWEIWNEPHVFGGSVFWHGITKDFAELQKIGYETVKKYQPGDESIVALGGIGARRYTKFYEEFVQTDAYDYYDVLAMHGYDIDPWTYNGIAEAYGKEPKPMVSTELHMMLRNPDSAYLYNTEKEEAIRMYVEFLKDIKYGALFTTFFQITQSVDANFLRWLWENNINSYTYVEGGLYEVGIDQPRFATIALHTFLNAMGKEYEYVDEYLLANKKQNVVRMKSDGEDQLIVWNVNGSKGVDTKLSNLITAAATEDFKVVDWENNEVDISDLNNIDIKTETVYFVTGLDSAKLDEIPSNQGEELYTGDVIFNNTEKQKNDKGSIIASVVGNGSTAPLFNKDTFALADDINYIEKGFKWVGENSNAQDGFTAKYAVSVAEDGMYLVVKANDAVDAPRADEYKSMPQADSIQFAIDTVGDRSETGFMEVYAGIDWDGRQVVYKKLAPYIGGDIISDFVPSDTVIKNARIERTSANGETTYLVYLPTMEIYPYQQNVYEAMNFSLRINNNNGSGKLGYLEWGGGLSDDKGDAMKFGSIWLDSEVAKENGIYYPPFALGSDTPLFDKTTFAYADNINWITDDFVYVKQTKDDPDFKARFAASVTDEGLYFAAEVDDAEHNMASDKAGDLWGKDSLQLGIDPGQRGVTDDRIEFQIGRIASGGNVVYKGNAPSVAETLAPDGYTQQGNAAPNAICHIEETADKIIYKVFIPAVEFYQFNIADNDVMKLSVLINQNTGGTRIGYLEWASGIGGNKNAKQYGIVSYK